MTINGLDSVRHLQRTVQCNSNKINVIVKPGVVLGAVYFMPVLRDWQKQRLSSLTAHCDIVYLLYKADKTTTLEYYFVQ